MTGTGLDTDTPGASIRPLPSSRPVPRGRLALLLGGGLCMLLGVDAGLLLLGLPAPVSTERLLEVHGQLMLVGFLGTVIALERAVALRRTWGFAAPLATGLGSLMLLTALPMAVGQGVQLVGLIVLVAIYGALWRRAASTAVAIQWLGAVMALGGGLLWASGVATGALFPWMAGFLVLTIAGERLELAHVAAPGPGAQAGLVAIASAVAVGAASALLWPSPGTEVFGMALLATVGWLVRFDVATRTVRSVGLPRYSAVNLLLAMVWLAVAGSAWVLLGPQADGPGYDLVVHAVTLGFAMSMVLAHAPIILPAVLVRPLPYRPVLYAATVALQVSLLLRVAGDLRGIGWVWQVGGAGNVVALLGFVALSAVLVVRR